MAELILYVVFGVLTVAVNLISYFLFRKVFEINAASIFAWICAVLFAYVTNKLFVFRSKKLGSKKTFFEFAKFIGSRIFSEIVELVLLNILLNADSVRTKEVIVKISVNILVVVLNYVASKIFVFK